MEAHDQPGWKDEDTEASADHSEQHRIKKSRMTYVDVRFSKLDPSTPDPKYMTDGASGFDLPVVKSELVGHGIFKLKTGLVFEIPTGYEGLIRTRSSTFKAGFVVLPGTIDSDYRGEVVVMLRHTSVQKEMDDAELWVAMSQMMTDGSYFSVAQMVIAPVHRANLTPVASPDELGKTARGSGGFGSTGRTV